MRQRWVEFDWGRMRVWEDGDGPTLLAIHGLGGSGRYFRPLARRLRDRYRIVAPDLAGFGASDKPDVTYDRDFHLDTLDAVLRDATGAAADVRLIGHSLGGTMAALWAARHPGRVAGLALAAAPFPSGDDAHPWMRDGVAPPRARGRLAVIRALVPLLAFPFGVVQGYPPGVSLDYGRQRFVPRVRTLWSALNDPRAVEVLAPLSGLTAPTLIVNARDDRSVGLEAQDAWARLLPAAERVVLEDGAHQFLLRGDIGRVVGWLRGIAP